MESPAHKRYYAAIDADTLFTSHLIRVYGAKNARDMRYRTNEFRDPQLLAAFRRKLAADQDNLGI